MQTKNNFQYISFIPGYQKHLIIPCKLRGAWSRVKKGVHSVCRKCSESSAFFHVLRKIVCISSPPMALKVELSPYHFVYLHYKTIGEAITINTYREREKGVTFFLLNACILHITAMWRLRLSRCFPLVDVIMWVEG